MTTIPGSPEARQHPVHTNWLDPQRTHSRR